jgi:hypothetical protein
MTTQEKITEALFRVQSCRRTLALARQVRDNSYHMAFAADVVTSLARQLANAELEAARLIGPTGHTFDCGGFISVAKDDRRAAPRPRFLYRHSHAMECAG